MFWKITVLVVLMLSPSSVYAVTPVKDMIETKVDKFQLFYLAEDDIKMVRVHWGTMNGGRKNLTETEVHQLITILHNVRIENIQPFKGPFPKGGPTQMTLLLKSGEKISLTLNGPYILYGENQIYQIYQPEIRQFASQITTTSLRNGNDS